MANSYSRRKLLRRAIGLAGASIVGGALSDETLAARLLEELDDNDVLSGPDVSTTRRASEAENAKSGTDWLRPSIDEEVRSRLANGNLVRSQSLNIDTPAVRERTISLSVGRLVDGYADDMSINSGESIRFRISSQLGPYVVAVVRLGWYGGSGATDVYRSSPLPGVSYPGSYYVSPGWDATGTVSLNWPVALTISTGGWSSGFYLASLIPISTGVPESYIPFVVRDDSSTASIVMQIPFTTYQAYNYWGGKHLYTGDDGIAATVVSFDRPYHDLGGTGHLFMGDHQVLGWLEQHNYPVTYATSIDTHRNPALMDGRKVFLSVHHDEYWSQAMRNNAVSWIAGGKSLAMLCANNIYWRVRFEPNPAGVPNRLMACYKGHQEPSIEKTILFKDLGQTEAHIEGVEFAGAAYDDSDWVVTAASHWLYQGTGLSNGSRIAGVIGGEWDKVVAQTPSDTTVVASVPKNSYDFGPTVQASVIRDMASGATVFAASTLKFGLFFGGQRSIRADLAIAQITSNLLAHIGVDPDGEPPATTTTTTTTTPATTTTEVPGSRLTAPPVASLPPVPRQHSSRSAGPSSSPRRPASGG